MSIKTKEEETKYYHPLYRYVIGQRLYFITIDINGNGERAEEELRDCLNAFAKNSRSHLYVTFGISDFILSIWATAKIIEDLEESLSSSNRISSFQALLIENPLPWYRRKIENNEEFREIKKREKLLKLLINNAPPDFLCHVPDEIDSELVEFFVFIESEQGAKFPQYEVPDSVFSNNHLKEIINLSVYTYSTKDALGVLIKGSCRKNTYHRSAEELMSYLMSLKEAKVTSATYFIGKKIPEQKNSVDGLHKSGKTRRAVIGQLQHLFDSTALDLHGFPDVSLDNAHTPSSEYESFVEVIYDTFNDSLSVDLVNFEDQVRELREFATHVAAKNNKMVKIFFVEKVIMWERELCELINCLNKKNTQIDKSINKGLVEHIDKVISEYDGSKDKAWLSKKIMGLVHTERKRQDNATLNPESYTLGNVLQALNSCAKSWPDKSLEQLVLSDEFKNFQGKLSNDLRELRNQLMHGRVIDMFEVTGSNGDRQFWVEFLKSVQSLHYDFLVTKQRLAEFVEKID